MAEKKKRKFKLFDSQREGKGVEKKDVEKTPGLKKFWRIYRENFFNRLLYVNIIMIVGNFPLIFWIMAIAGLGQAEVTSPNDNLFGLLYGIHEYTANTPASLAMIGVTTVHGVSYVNTFVSYLFWGLGALTFLTWGIINAGAAYVLRNLSTEQPVFMFSDFVDTAKKNWKQALPFGIIDLIVMLLLPLNIYSSITSGQNFFASFFFWLTIFVTLLYIVMRWYVYLQIVSFNMKMPKIIKNSLYFVLLGVKRNIPALLGNITLIALVVFCLLGFGGKLVALALFIPALLLFSTCTYMGVYAAWYKIDDIMVIHDDDDDAPSQSNEDEDEDDDDDDEAEDDNEDKSPPYLSENDSSDKIDLS